MNLMLKRAEGAKRIAMVCNGFRRWCIRLKPLMCFADARIATLGALADALRARDDGFAGPEAGGDGSGAGHVVDFNALTFEPV